MDSSFPDASVFLVDADPDLRESLRQVLRRCGIGAMGFASMSDFLAYWHPDMAGCLLLDISDAGTHEPVIPVQLQECSPPPPFIVTSSGGGLDTCRRAFHAGAMDFLPKPLDMQALTESIRKAMSALARQRRLRDEATAFRRQLSQLSERESQVLELMLEGMPNKIIAQRIGLSTRTVESHRSRIYLKLETDSLAQLVRRVVRLEKSTG